MATFREMRVLEIVEDDSLTTEQKIAELQAKWNRLPSSVRQAMLQRKKQHREARRMQKAEMSGASQTSARPVR